MTLEGIAVGLTGLTDAHFIQHVKRCAVALGQFAQGTPSDRETALIVEFSGDRREVAIRAVQITP